jgi:GT2 family glycosyltransferase
MAGSGPSVDLSVVIVHYETPTLLADCLRSLGPAKTDLSLEVFVVDNASVQFDPAACEAAYPGVRVIRNERNAGFAVASNQGLRAARGRYRLLLNPDTLLAADSLRSMVDYMDARPDVGCSTCRLEMDDGSLDLACRRSFPTPAVAFYRMTMLSRLFPRSRRFGRYNLTYLDEWEETEIDAPCGAFMLVRAEVVEGVGLLDERYFMYGEDLDWAYRIKAAGWRIMYTPVTTVRHRKRASSRRFRERTVRYFHDGMRRFYRAHYEDRQPRWVSLAVLSAIAVRERIELTGIALARLTRSRPG